MKVYLMGGPSGPFDQLGLMEVTDGTLEQRVAAAKAEGLRRGGNAIVLQGSRTEQHSRTTHEDVKVEEDCHGINCKTHTVSVPSTSVSSSAVQTFVVILEHREPELLPAAAARP